VPLDTLEFECDGVGSYMEKLVELNCGLRAAGDDGDDISKLMSFKTC
jgi:hypothetical protein